MRLRTPRTAPDLSTLPTSKAAAKLIGSTIYYDGKPCKKAGHISHRFTISGTCAACAIATTTERRRAKNEIDYQAGHTKIPTRRTGIEMQAVRDAIIRIANGGDGMTVRHLFYRLVAEGVVEKTERQYDGTVCRLALELRREGEIEFGKIVDESRSYVQPQTFDDVKGAIGFLSRIYRKSYWTDESTVVEVWCEKETIGPVIEPITMKYGVPLMVTHGFTSETVCQTLAERVQDEGKDSVVILGLNDFDPSGQKMLPAIVERLAFYAPSVEFLPIQVALTADQVKTLRLPTRPTKTKDNRHAADWNPSVESVELDAMRPADLRNMLEGAILAHIDIDLWNKQLEEERAGRKALRELVPD